MAKKTFTLTEVIVASMIAAIIVTGVIAAIVYVRSLNIRERDRLVVATYLNSIVERLVFKDDFLAPSLNIGTHSISTTRLPTDDDLWLKTNPRITYAITSADCKINPTIPHTACNNAVLAKEINAAISWQWPGKKQQTLNIYSIKLKK